MTTFSETAMIFLSIFIQIPTCLMQLILIWEDCNANYININVAEAISLLILSYLFIFIRSATHWIDHDMPTFIIYTLFYQMIQILSIHCFVYWTETNLNGSDCDLKYNAGNHRIMTQYVNILFFIWIIYDFSMEILYCLPYLFGDIKRIWGNADICN